jgi:hypothetical protein
MKRKGASRYRRKQNGLDKNFQFQNSFRREMVQMRITTINSFRQESLQGKVPKDGAFSCWGKHIISEGKTQEKCA